MTTSSSSLDCTGTTFVQHRISTARVARCAICREFARLYTVYPIVENKVLRVDSTCFRTVFELFDKEIKLRESVDVLEVVYFRQQ